jgi:hypothetical protein
MTRPYYPVSRYTRRQYRAQAVMLRLLAGAILAALLAMALLASDLVQAQGQPPLARFEGGIGEQDAARNGAVLIVNDVNGVLPGGRPWVIAGLSASATTTRIRAEGRGLLLAGGAGIGTNGAQVVHAMLQCNALPYESASVPLDENGDFSIDSGFVGANGNPPDPCVNPRLLIVNAGNAWFAAGIPKR